MEAGYLLKIKKGQVLSFDLLIAITIFTLVFSILVSQVNYNTKKINELKEQNKMIEEAYKISEIFFREGYPKNWDENNVDILGLQTNNRIDWNKLEKLKNLGYQKSLILLGASYDYNITLQSNTIKWSFGKSIENYSTIVKISRLGILNSSIVSIQVLVLKP
jgi:hypothetical protein